MPHGTWWEPTKEQREAAQRHGVPVWFENALGMRFVLIPRGRYVMGSAQDEPGRGPDETSHEVVISDRHLKETGITTMDVAKRLMDYGFHPPTVYFPLVVKGAMLVEPTETETKQALDEFVEG